VTHRDKISATIVRKTGRKNLLLRTKGRKLCDGWKIRKAALLLPGMAGVSGSSRSPVTAALMNVDL
jgi:hypothetical protein